MGVCVFPAPLIARAQMKLSDDFFTEIRKTLRLDEGDADVDRSAQAATADGRREDRVDASHRRVPIAAFGTLQRRHAVTLLDLGPRGVSFLDNRAWGAGEKIIMYVPRTLDHVVPLLCVVRNTRVVDGLFRVGAEFAHEHEASATQVMRDINGDVSGSAEAVSDESAGRRAPRSRLPRAAAWAQMHTYDQGKAGPILEAEVVDLSENGIGLICAAEVTPGRKLVVRFCPPGGKTITRMCEVVTCRPLDAGGYRVGMRFTAYEGRSLVGALFGWLRNKS
ncbi:MAG: PilZ domain [Humisphaera sp.]|nr:PilZ domain [Humisphaera sp.]